MGSENTPVMSNRGRAIRAPRNSPAKRRILVIAGAIIVFLTFIVKEEAREYLKDLKESLAAADNLYTLEQDIEGVELQIVKVEQDINGAEIRQRTATARNPTVMQYPAEIKNSIAMLRKQDGIVRSSFDRISRLADKMPFDRAYIRQPFAEMKKALDAFHETIEHKVNEIQACPQDATALALAQVDFAHVILMEVVILKLGDDVLDGVRTEEEVLEKAYSRFTWISSFLFVSGWVMGLYGALSGAHIPGGES